MADLRKVSKIVLDNTTYEINDKYKQDKLVSGNNIKTINGVSLLGSGNITTPTISEDEIINIINNADIYGIPVKSNISSPLDVDFFNNNDGFATFIINDAVYLAPDTTYKIPNGCQLIFTGYGSLFSTGNGAIITNISNSESTEGVQIIAPKKQIFGDEITLSCVLRNDAVYPEWFGAIGNGVDDDTNAIQKAVYSAGHTPVVLTAEQYLVSKTINLIEPYSNTTILSQYYYAHAHGKDWNDKQTLIVEHDIIGDSTLAGPVVRVGASNNTLIVKGAVVVHNATEDACGVSTIGNNLGTTNSDFSQVSHGDLSVSNKINVRMIIHDADSYSYYNTSNEANRVTTYGIGKGRGIIFWGVPNAKCEIGIIRGFKIGVHITSCNGSTITVRESSNLIAFQLGCDATKSVVGGITRNVIRLGSHILGQNWSWVKNKTEDIIIFNIDGVTKGYGNNVSEVANNHIVIDGDNTGNYQLYNYLIKKTGNSNFTGNVFDTAYTQVYRNFNPWKFVSIQPNTTNPNYRTGNNGNKFLSRINIDYDTIDMNYGFNSEIGPVMLDSAKHTTSYRFMTTLNDTRFVFDKIVIAPLTFPEMKSESGTSVMWLYPNESQWSKIHSGGYAGGTIYGEQDYSSPTNCKANHLYILDDESTDTYLAIYGWHNNTFGLVGYILRSIVPTAYSSLLPPYSN